MKLIFLGAVLFFAGWAHRTPTLARIDSRFFWALHSRLRRKPFISIFKLLWPLGTTPFTLLVLLILTIYDFKLGLIAIGLFILVVSLEWLIKRSIDRPRPFSFLHNVKVLQPRHPKDASFPSGDSLRVWYIALIIPAAIGLALPFKVATIILAALVTLGRPVLGVHFPTDAIAGAGLGILAAGVWSALLLIF